MPRRKPKQQSAYTMAGRAKAIEAGGRRVEVLFAQDDARMLAALEAAGFADSGAECIRRAVREAASRIDK